MVGYAAATKRGFSTAGGIIGGALLGILSPLMFFVSGISRADADMKKCPACAEMIKREAVKCRYCGERLAEEA